MGKLPRLSLTRVVIALAVVAVGYFVFSVIGDALLSRQLERDEQQLQLEIAELRRDQRELEAIRSYLETDEYIEGVARHILGLVRPGETLIVVSTSATPTPLPDGAPADDRPWWEILYGP